MSSVILVKRKNMQKTTKPLAELKKYRILRFKNKVENGDISLSMVARETGASREYVRQIMVWAGVNNAEASAITAQRKKEKNVALRTIKEVSFYGDSVENLTKKYGEHWKGHIVFYRCKRRNVKRLNVIRDDKNNEWELTYADWLSVWSEFNHGSSPESWHTGDARHGVHKNCACLVRKDKLFPFKIGNVEIVYFSNFIKELRAKEKQKRSENLTLDALTSLTCSFQQK